MKKEYYTVVFKVKKERKKERELIEVIGGEIIEFNASIFWEMVIAKLTDEMAQNWVKSPKTDWILKEKAYDKWDD